MIYVALVNWNGFGDTIECLESLLRMQGNNWRAVICDNGSTDGSIAEIVAWASRAGDHAFSGPAWQYVGAERQTSVTLSVVAPDADARADTLITIIDAKKNLGFAGACNLGARLALRDETAEFVWFLNNDTVVGEHALAKLIERMDEDPQAGIAGATLIYSADAATVQGLGVRHNNFTGRASVIGSLCSINSLPGRDEVEQNLTCVLGASMFVRRSLLEIVGLMSERYFLYYEELDWAERSKGLFRTVWAPGALVFHKEGKAIGTKMKGRGSNLSIYFLTVNSLRFFMRFHPLSIPLVLLRHAYIVGRFLMQNDWIGCKIVSVAIMDFFFSRYRREDIVKIQW